MTVEEWRPVDGWPYEVSSLGRVRRLETGRPLSPLAHSKGYLRVNLTRPGVDGLPGQRRQEYVHTLVCVAWHGARPPGMQVDHVDADRTNNAAHNLRWLPAVDNGTRYHAWYAERAGIVEPEWTEADDAELEETLRAFERPA